MTASCVPPPDVQSEIVGALDVNAAVRLLEEIEQLPAGATGALLVASSTGPAGSVFVENGRVCWAVANGMRHRLTDLLRHQTDPPLAPALVEDVYRACIQGGGLLGEELVNRGIVSGDGLRRALRQHTSEAMMLLSRTRDEQRPGAWVTHRRRRYNAKYTFLPSEILVGIARQRVGSSALDAHAHLEGILNESGGGAAFMRAAGLALPLPIATYNEPVLGVRLVVELGRWAMSSLDLAGVFSSQRQLVTASAPNGASFMAWEHGGLVFVALCPERTTFARALMKSFAQSPGP
ncbi:hypothetical protein LZC95_33420 [Pendulispora brunnea]|uniref:DUF4388 domain-containing protein n=1 Tax=Pendulispora brunnea TaxID=2905690 RepID=A0ABZ2K1W0_9BACT